MTKIVVIGGGRPSQGGIFPTLITASTNWALDYDIRLTNVEDRYEMETKAKGLIEAANKKNYSNRTGNICRGSSSRKMIYQGKS